MSNSFKEKPQSNIAEKTKPSRAVLGIITREDGTREVAVNTTAIPGGGADDLFTLLANQILDATKINRHSEADATQRYNAAIAAFHQIAPGPLEGMLATQLIASHMAMMDCYAHLNRTNDRITHEYHLNHVNKLSRTSVALLEALNRHRRKGQQKVTVEHVHVHAGGQAVVGTVESTGGGDKAKLEDQPHAKQTAHAPQPEVWSEDKERGSMPITSDGERPVSHARGKVTRSADGEQ